MWRRLIRTLLRGLAVAAAASVVGCGWHPVYAPQSSDAGGVGSSLSRIDVAIISERGGQLLRQALQSRLGDPAGQAADYLLEASFSVTQEGLAILQNSSVTRIRRIATSTYTLRSLGEGQGTCVSGTARSVDGYDTQNEQFFASDLESETVDRRLARAVADQIVMKLALALGRGKSCEVR